MRGGAREGAGGKKPKLPADQKRRKDTVTLLPSEWGELDEIGPSRGKAISKLLKGNLDKKAWIEGTNSADRILKETISNALKELRPDSFMDWIRGFVA